MKKFAFTMAEILISLTIIGIIAAITLPALQSNINEKTWNTQRKALFSRMTQAISMMPSLNGYGVVADENETKNNATQAFIAELGKTLKINNVCDSEHLVDCGINQDGGHFKVNNLKGSQISYWSVSLDKYLAENSADPVHIGEPMERYAIKTGAFETANGEHILVYYNPYCIGNSHRTDGGNPMLNKVCANFIYDLNGTKGPNTVGKDVGVISALYSSDSMVAAPMPMADIAGKEEFVNASNACRTQDEDSRLPNLEEAIAIRMNVSLFDSDIAQNATDPFWTNKIEGSDRAWLYLKDGFYEAWNKNQNALVWCIKR